MSDPDSREQYPARERSVSPEGALRSYDQRKHALAQIVREGLAAGREVKNEQVERTLQELSAKLAGDHFNLVVVGQFSRGKSTLMNAILGKAYLPSGIVPVTSVITAVSYGSRECVVLRQGNSILTQEIPIRELVNYVTEQVNPGNRRGITIAEVQAPVEILRRGFFFVDTPGLGSAVSENTATTLNFLPEADAIVFVTSCDAPLTQAEIIYLRECRAQVRSLFVVANKIDLAAGAERAEILNFVESKVREELNAPAQRVFAVSARNALGARVKGDADHLAQSGLPSLEEELIQYLTARKQDDFLLGTCDRIESLLRSSGLIGMEPLLERVAEMRSAIIQESGLSGENAEVRGRAYRKEAPGTVPLLRWSCAICDEIINAVFEFLRIYQYDLSVSEETQLAHARAGGFCAFHTWQYTHLASPQGVSSAYPHLLFRFSRELRDLAQFGTEGHPSCDVVDPPIPPRGTCRACRIASETEERALRNFAASPSAGTAAKSLASKNFCLDHLHDLLLDLSDTEAGRLLLMRQSQNLTRVGENLQRYALRFDGRRRDLTTDEELQAPYQGLAMLVGHPNAQHSSVRRIRQ
jgi:GTP-binding protein EngB required for normal cell division